MDVKEKQKISIPIAAFRIIRLIFFTVFTVIILLIFFNFIPALNAYTNSVIILGLILSVLFVLYCLIEKTYVIWGLSFHREVFLCLFSDVSLH